MCKKYHHLSQNVKSDRKKYICLVTHNGFYQLKKIIITNKKITDKIARFLNQSLTLYVGKFPIIYYMLLS